MLIMGIDPGKKGGIAVIDENCKCLGAIEMPLIKNGENKGEIDSSFIYTLISQYKVKNEIICYIEKAYILHNQGLKSNLTYGMGYGELKGVIKASKIKYTEVHPTTWKSKLSLLKKGKVGACEMSKMIFPDESVVTSRGRLMDGKAEALLIAYYGLAMMNIEDVSYD